MRQSNQKSRSRGRSRKPQNPMSRNFESNGPDVKIRGNASHIAEKYTTLARDCLSNGDRVIAENYLQHAEHYNRIVAAAQQQADARAAEIAEKRQSEPDNNDEQTVSEDNNEAENAVSSNTVAENSAEAETDDSTKDRKPARNKRPRKQATSDVDEGEEKPPVRKRKPKVAPEAISDDAATLPGSILGGMVAEEG